LDKTLSAPKMGSPKRRAILDFGPVYLAIINYILYCCLYLYCMQVSKKKKPAKGMLDLTTLRRTTAIVRKRSNIYNLHNLDTAAVYATDC